MDPLCLPDAWPSRAGELARTRARFTRLWPDGVHLRVDVAGDPIPTLGAGTGADDYPAAESAGQIWRPDDEVYGADGVVDESTLPSWTRAIVRGN